MRRRTLLSSGKKDYSQEYFTMVVTTGGNITWTGAITDNILSYSKDNGNTWTTVNSGTTISVAAGDNVLWKGASLVPKSNKGIGSFSGDTNARYSVEGNVMSLLYDNDFEDKMDLSGKNYTLEYLFKYNTNITSAENLSLPATTLATWCYYRMFIGCTSLTTAPALPATTLATWCYGDMFRGCTSLTTSPELPVTTLAEQCYNGMFYDCTSLTTAPELPATTLATNCYFGMFRGCTSLTTSPELPATALAERCYYYMFYGCTSLTTAPELPATTILDRCYYYMFYGCTSLTTAPELPATTSLAKYCYEGMFYGCTSLSSIKCLLITNINTNNYCLSWLINVAESGTFVKAASMTNWATGASGIPTGWTVVDDTSM